MHAPTNSAERRALRRFFKNSGHAMGCTMAVSRAKREGHIPTVLSKHETRQRNPRLSIPERRRLTVLHTLEHPHYPLPSD